MTNILQNGDPVLRKKAAAVPLDQIKTPKIVKVLEAMYEALNGEADGVAIAAPQIGESLRIFMVSELVFKIKKAKKDADNATKETPSKESVDTTPVKPLICINPEIIKISKDKKKMEEGCLSVRPLYGKVLRSNKVTIRAYDENGNLFERGGSGLLAQIFQHENDHLDGKLFIDTAEDVHEMDINDSTDLDDELEMVDDIEE